MAKTKYENYSKQQLIAKLEKLEKKGYGLVWEDKPEKIADKCEKELPVLVEDKKKEIKKDQKKPTHFIFEGDNYHTLYTLNFTHKKGIDVIYIDPPYNTGKTDKNGVTDFRYNDRFIKKEDRFRHSTWLSFMNKRLRLAKNLLKETGVIAISIDDNEVSNLKLLCDKIFGELNHIATVPTIMNLKGNQDQFGFAGTHEYTLFYGRNKLKAKLNNFDVDEKELEKWIYDDYGIYKKGANLKATGGNAPRSKRPNLYYPIFINTSKELYVTENDKKLNDTDIELLPITDGNEMSWRWEKEKVKKDIHNIILVGDDESYSIYKKQRPKLGDIPTKKPKSIFYKPEYSSGNGTTQLKKIFNGKKVFNNPKPLKLIKDILHVCSNKNSVILDFFAGSSTSGHAVLELNNEDDGNRQIILCTNNENNICKEVTYPRMQKVINGYNNIKGISANLKYFKTDYVPTVLTDNDKRNLVAKSTELLCISENTFEVVTDKSIQNEYAIFKNKIQHTAIIYDEDFIEECCIYLNKLKDIKETIIYVFSYDHNYMEEDFDNLNNNFKVKPIPEVILNVYRKIAKLKNK